MKIHAYSKNMCGQPPDQGNSAQLSCGHVGLIDIQNYHGQDKAF